MDLYQQLRSDPDDQQQGHAIESSQTSLHHLSDINAFAGESDVLVRVASLLKSNVWKVPGDLSKPRLLSLFPSYSLILSGDKRLADFLKGNPSFAAASIAKNPALAEDFFAKNRARVYKFVAENPRRAADFITKNPALAADFFVKNPELAVDFFAENPELAADYDAENRATAADFITNNLALAADFVGQNRECVADYFAENQTLAANFFAENLALAADFIAKNKLAALSAIENSALAAVFFAKKRSLAANFFAENQTRVVDFVTKNPALAADFVAKCPTRVAAFIAKHPLASAFVAENPGLIAYFFAENRAHVDKFVAENLRRAADFITKNPALAADFFAENRKHAASFVAENPTLAADFITKNLTLAAAYIALDLFIFSADEANRCIKWLHTGTGLVFEAIKCANNTRLHNTLLINDSNKEEPRLWAIESRFVGNETLFGLVHLSPLYSDGNITWQVTYRSADFHRVDTGQTEVEAAANSLCRAGSYVLCAVSHLLVAFDFNRPDGTPKLVGNQRFDEQIVHVDASNSATSELKLVAIAFAGYSIRLYRLEMAQSGSGPNEARFVLEETFRVVCDKVHQLLFAGERLLVSARSEDEDVDRLWSCRVVGEQLHDEGLVQIDGYEQKLSVACWCYDPIHNNVYCVNAVTDETLTIEYPELIT